MSLARLPIRFAQVGGTDECVRPYTFYFATFALPDAAVLALVCATQS
jgi:hypothetical protein